MWENQNPTWKDTIASFWEGMLFTKLAWQHQCVDAWLGRKCLLARLWWPCSFHGSPSSHSCVHERDPTRGDKGRTGALCLCVLKVGRAAAQTITAESQILGALLHCPHAQRCSCLGSVSSSFFKYGISKYQETVSTKNKVCHNLFLTF